MASRSNTSIGLLLLVISSSALAANISIPEKDYADYTELANKKGAKEALSGSLFIAFTGAVVTLCLSLIALGLAWTVAACVYLKAANFDVGKNEEEINEKFESIYDAQPKI